MEYNTNDETTKAAALILSGQAPEALNEAKSEEVLKQASKLGYGVGQSISKGGFDYWKGKGEDFKKGFFKGKLSGLVAHLKSLEEAKDGAVEAVLTEDEFIPAMERSLKKFKVSMAIFNDGEFTILADDAKDLKKFLKTEVKLKDKEIESRFPSLMAESTLEEASNRKETEALSDALFDTDHKGILQLLYTMEEFFDGGADDEAGVDPDQWLEVASAMRIAIKEFKKIKKF